jgi:hypothetical protein
MGSGVDPAMKDQTNFDARKGAAKKIQSSFPDHPGMKTSESFKGAGPANAGSGPDASAPNVMDPEPRGKTLHRQAQILQTPWGNSMKDADGKGVDASMSGKVLGQAILSGSDKLPAFVKEETSAKGSSPKP